MTGNARAANRVLASIPRKEYKRLHDLLEPVELKFGQVLYEPGKPIRYVYFPVDCLISLLTAVDKRRTLEVGMVGNEGMAGMPFILGMGVSGVRAIVQGRGNALRMGAAPFRVEFDRNRPLQEALFRYTYALMAQVSQTAACNRFHEAEARLSRWLLMTRDRVASDDFPLTHEFLAHMLGLRREGDNLKIEPCISKDWNNYEISYRFGRAMYHIRVENPRGVNHGVSQIVMDGRVLPDKNIPLLDDEQNHEIVITLG